MRVRIELRTARATILSVLIATLLLTSPADAAGTWSNDQAANVVLGQPNFTTSVGGSISASVMTGGSGVAVDPTTGKVFIADNGNRVLRFSSAAAAVSGSAAEAVFGQSNFNVAGSNAGNGAVAAANSLRAPIQIVVDSDGHLWVADRDNNRVLRFDNASTKATFANADGVLGQPNFVANAANRGGNVAANTLNGPTGVWVDSISLWVADDSNHRVLAFGLPASKSNGADADIVLGQVDFTHNAANGPANVLSRMRNPKALVMSSSGALFVADSLNSRVLRFDDANIKTSGAAADGVLGHTGPLTQSAMSAPEAVAIDSGGRLFVADTGANRVLIFNDAATKANSANADNVLGQTGYTTGTQNAGGVSASSLSVPRGMVFDNVSNVLWVTDYANGRALRYSPAGAATLDVDASLSASKYDALTDGLLILRYLFGLTGPALTGGALGATATRTDPAAVKIYLDGIRPALDIDGNATTDALTDGLLIIRYLFGLRGGSLISGAVAPNAARTTALQIEPYIQSLMP